MDVTRRESVEAAAQVVQEALKYIDIILITAASLETWTPMPEQDPDAWWST